jgi:hypothetical protein
MRAGACATIYRLADSKDVTKQRLCRFLREICADDDEFGADKTGFGQSSKRGHAPSAGGGPTAPNWGNGYMPAAYQGTQFRSSGPPIVDLKPPADRTPEEQTAWLKLLNKLNEQHLEKNPLDTELSARIYSYELAYRMQSSAMDAIDINKESAATRALYGIDDDRMSERTSKRPRLGVIPRNEDAARTGRIERSAGIHREYRRRRVHTRWRSDCSPRDAAVIAAEAQAIVHRRGIGRSVHRQAKSERSQRR